MPEGISKAQLAVYAAIVLAVVVLGARYLRGSSSPAPAPASAPVRVEQDRGAGGGAMVHVAGAVRSPGVYRLRPGARVDDALQLAGGPTRHADLGAVNLAAKAEDGRQILVPERARSGAAAAGAPGAAGAGGVGSAAGATSASRAAAGTGAGAAAATSAAGATPAQPLNLNAATLEQLDALDGIGPSLAQAILEFREENGGFGSVEELAQVPGIGEKRLASLREQVRV